MSAISGMFGEIASGQAAERDLCSMLSGLKTRGPDGVASYVNRFEQIALGFCFLRTAADEPNPNVFTNEDRSIFVVCDGHVFNHLELRPSLEAKGRSLRSSHSAELLLHLYEQEGIQGWCRADGQFALALWDQRRRQLVLGRDCLGVRSLYFCHSGAGVVFASEPKALLLHPRVPRAVDETAVSHFLTFTSVPGPRTLFKGISKLEPGTAVVFKLDGSVRPERYWDILQNLIRETDDERFYVDRVRELHTDAVRTRKVDGPIASLLSGGNDSSANASLLARFGASPLHTFTVGLAGLEGNERYNDLEYARRVARYIRSEHHEYLLSTDEFLAKIPRTIDAMDDLVSEPSSVFLYSALEMARNEGLRVVVTGEANDELCCGHGGMIHIRDGYYRRWLPLTQKPALIRRALAATAPLFSPKRLDVLKRAAKNDEYFWSYETAWMDTDKTSVLALEIVAQSADIVASCKQRFDNSPHGSRDYLFYIIYSMLQDYYFGNLMLGKLDLLSASLGLEARCPYTAPEYAHFVYNVPVHLKTRDGLVKYFFKKAIEGVLPNEIIYRPKQGFRTPVVELFQGTLGRWAEPILLETGLSGEGMLRKDHLREVLRKHRDGEGDYANRLWTAMVLNLWHERWIKNMPTVGNLATSAGAAISR
jgi:asparagine synthase (glutamine-hydrolysing)